MRQHDDQGKKHISFEMAKNQSFWASNAKGFFGWWGDKKAKADWVEIIESSNAAKHKEGSWLVARADGLS